MEHKTDFYTDDFKKVEFCKVCGVENPSGECPAKYVKPKNSKPIDNKQEQD